MHPLRLCLIVAIAFASGACTAQDRNADAQTFWSAFRQAVLDGDKTRVAAMTRFPFEVRGPSDHDPVKRLSRDGFVENWERFIEQPVLVPIDGRIVERSMRQLIEDRPRLAQADPSAASLRYQQFEFRRVKGRWMFTRAYLEE